MISGFVCKGVSGRDSRVEICPQRGGRYHPLLWDPNVTKRQRKDRFPLCLPQFSLPSESSRFSCLWAQGLMVATPYSQPFNLGLWVAPLSPLVFWPSDSSASTSPAFLVLHLMESRDSDFLSSVNVWANSYSKYPYIIDSISLENPE